MAEEEFAVTGLAPSQAFLLMAVNDKPGIQPKEISAQMQLTASTVTRLIEKMEQRRFLERKFIGKFTKVYPTLKSRKLDFRQFFSSKMAPRQVTIRFLEWRCVHARLHQPRRSPGRKRLRKSLLMRYSFCLIAAGVVRNSLAISSCDFPSI